MPGSPPPQFISYEQSKMHASDHVRHLSHASVRSHHSGREGADEEEEEGHELSHLDKHGKKHDTIGWVANPAAAHMHHAPGVAPLPNIHHRKESSPAELFFDLFFVANLAAFTKGHKINDKSSLGDYIGFFSILWLTWLQVSMHDVRFPQESVLERVFKACHLGVMLGFAIVGVFFEPSEDIAKGVQTVHGRSFSRVLMASRLTLFAQYLLALWLVRRFKKMYVPLLLTGATYLISALTYLGISYAYEPKYQTQGAFVGWYAVAIIETAIVLAISVYFSGMGFKGTHISERMTLLTLIILGEGALGLATSIGTAWKSIADSRFALNAFVGSIMAAVLIIYFAYMLYFDMVPAKGFNNVRHAIWTSLHLPLHISMVIFVEGNAKAITWLCSVTTAKEWKDALLKVPLYKTLADAADVGAYPFGGSLNNTVYFETQAKLFNDTSQKYLKTFKDDATKDIVKKAIEVISKGTTESYESVLYSVVNVYGYMTNAIFYKFDIKTRDYKDPSANAPDKADDPTTLDTFRDANKKYLAYYDYWDLVFIYLFCTAGFYLILIGIMYYISRKTYSAIDYIRTAACIGAGVGVGLLSLMSITAAEQTSPGFEFVQSWWMLPSITFAFFVVVVVRHLPMYRVLKEVHPYAKV